MFALNREMTVMKFLNPLLVDSSILNVYLSRLAEVSVRTQQRFEELNRRLIRAEQELKGIQANALEEKRFWWIGGFVDAAFDKKMMLYDSVSRLLWIPPDVSADFINILPARILASMSRVGGLSGWRFPANGEIIDFSSHSSNPLRLDSSCRLLKNYAFFTSSHRIDLDDFSLENLGCFGAVILCNDLLCKYDKNQVTQFMVDRLWSLNACEAPSVEIL